MLGRRPLLVASASLVLTIGCGGQKNPPTVGNLMAPPDQTNEICVDPLPPDALVTIDGQAAPDRCSDVPSGAKVEIEVSAPGFVTQTREVLADGAAPIEVRLEPDGSIDVLEPVGNLMAPQPIDRR